MQGRLFVFIFFSSFLLLITGISVFNYKMDSNHPYSRLQVLECASDDLLSGKIIAGIENYNDRYLQKLVIKKMKGVPDTIAIGSSRTMLLRASYIGLDQGSFFNHSVAYALLKDHIAILGSYKRKGAFPKTIILGVDPWLFDKKSETALYSERWKSLFSDYYYLLTFIKGDISTLKVLYEHVQNKVSKAKKLLSYRYTIANYELFLGKKGNNYRVVKNTSVDAYLKMPDGSIYYPFKVRFRDDSITQEKSQNVLEAIKSYIFQLSFQETFISLIDYILNSGTQVIFFLHPYHPNTYQEISRKKELQFVVKIEEMLRSLAKSRNIPVIGSYDPSSFNFSSRDFFDGAHAHDYAVKEIFKGYRQVAGADN